MKSSSPGLSSPSFQETLEMRAAGGRDNDDRQQSDEESGSASEPERNENSDSDNKDPSPDFGGSPRSSASNGSWVPKVTGQVGFKKVLSNVTNNLL